jgi:transposase
LRVIGIDEVSYGRGKRKYLTIVWDHTRARVVWIVFDRFHIKRYLTQAVEEIRRQEFFRRGGTYRDAVRGKKWLLLTKFRRLRRHKRPELVTLLVMNRRLFKA